MFKLIPIDHSQFLSVNVKKCQIFYRQESSQALVICLKRVQSWLKVVDAVSN
ncbi:hypothetical protein BDW_13715 [Bdellovibrio bacteriovorus W]|nr:hypothetical protein BDW_13715 [Bdellovibrio bacteriovorus W]